MLCSATVAAAVDDGDNDGGDGDVRSTTLSLFGTLTAVSGGSVVLGVYIRITQASLSQTTRLICT